MFIVRSCLPNPLRKQNKIKFKFNVTVFLTIIESCLNIRVFLSSLEIKQ